jgi:hypothetical protein
VTKYERYNEKVDVFSLGCLMYELFARELRSAALLAQTPDGELIRQYALRVHCCCRAHLVTVGPLPACMLCCCFSRAKFQHP